MKQTFQNYFQESQEVFRDFLSQASTFPTLERAAKIMISALQNGGKIISCGNGGSMTDAMHFAEELCGKFREDRDSIPAIAISDPSYISCVANDYGYEFVFSRFVQSIAKTGDVLLAISTSGTSKNVLHAVKEASSKGVHTIALTGNYGSPLEKSADISICVPYSGYADRIQEIHIKIIHALIHTIEEKMTHKI